MATIEDSESTVLSSLTQEHKEKAAARADAEDVNQETNAASAFELEAKCSEGEAESACDLPGSS